MRFGETDTLAHKPTAPGAKRKMFSLNFLSISLSCNNIALGHVSLIRIICISINGVNLKRIQQVTQLIQVLMFTSTETIG